MPVSSVPAARKRGRLQVAVWRILQWEGPEWSWQVILMLIQPLGLQMGPDRKVLYLTADVNARGVIRESDGR